MEFASACSYYGSQVILSPRARIKLLDEMGVDSKAVNLRELDTVQAESTGKSIALFELISLEALGNHGE